MDIPILVSFIPLPPNAMAPTPEKSTGIDLGLFTIPQSLLLQVGTTSVLMLVLAQKAANQALEAIGQASEEVFRSDRLPILDFPQPEQNSK